MEPTIGRIVIYVDVVHTQPGQPGVKKAAIVSDTLPLDRPGQVDLHVFEKGPMSDHSGPPFAPVRWVGRVPFDETGTQPGSWHWPPRV